MIKKTHTVETARCFNLSKAFGHLINKYFSAMINIQHILMILSHGDEGICISVNFYEVNWYRYTWNMQLIIHIHWPPSLTGHHIHLIRLKYTGGRLSEIMTIEPLVAKLSGEYSTIWMNAYPGQSLTGQCRNRETQSQIRCKSDGNWWTHLELKADPLTISL